MNPIKEKHEKMRYTEMAKISGLHINTLKNLAEMTPEQLLKSVKVETALILQDRLKINILKHIKDYEKIK